MRGGAVAVAAGQPRPHALLQRLPRLLEGGELPGLAGGVAGGGAGAETRHELETSIQNWRDTFLNKYHEQARAEVGLDASLHSDKSDKKFVLL